MVSSSRTRTRLLVLGASLVLLVGACRSEPVRSIALATPPLSPSPVASPSARATLPSPSLSPPRPAPAPCAGFPVNAATVTIAGRGLSIERPAGATTRVPVVLALAGYDQSRQKLDSIAGLTRALGSQALVAVAEGLGAPLAWQFKQGQTRDVSWLSQVIGSLTATCGDPRRVLVAGLSDGGVMAVRAACSIGGLAALVTASASSNPPEGCIVPGSFLAVHGTEDSFDPYQGDGKDIPPARSAIAAWAQAAHCTRSSESSLQTDVSQLAYAGCARPRAVALITMQGAPHGWPTSFNLTDRLLGLLPSTSTSFVSSVAALTPADLPHSWRSGCPVAPSSLRRLTMSYWGFDAMAHMGTLDVNEDSVAGVVGVFRQLFDAHFPIRQMRTVEPFGGSDDQSTMADNTAGFNCRQAVGGSGYSQHAYGHAIDIDPVENPYIDNGKVLPANGAAYADRSQHEPGMVHPRDVVYNAFYSIGWRWGGYFSGTPDYQHFSLTGT